MQFGLTKSGPSPLTGPITVGDSVESGGDSVGGARASIPSLSWEQASFTAGPRAFAFHVAQWRFLRVPGSHRSLPSRPARFGYGSLVGDSDAI